MAEKPTYKELEQKIKNLEKEALEYMRKEREFNEERKLVDYGHLKRTISLLKINEEKGCVDAEFSEKQLSLFNFWQKSFLDRLIILGSSYNEAKKAINLARLGKDVINIESVALFEQVLTCKLGTDAAGLIPRLGKILRTAKLTVFNPKKIHLFLKTQPQLVIK